MVQLFTIGHSNRSFQDFLSLLREFGVRVIADIRRYPGSHKFPHFNREILRKLLDAQGIRYVWLEVLGGRRHTGKNDKSPPIVSASRKRSSGGLKSLGFRNYADHMTADEFRTAVQELITIAEISPTAVMCAEKFYWKCHRRLLSDYLTAQGAEVKHIVESGKLQPHKLSPGAVIAADAMVIYPSSRASQTLEEKSKPLT